MYLKSVELLLMVNILITFRPVLYVSLQRGFLSDVSIVVSALLIHNVKHINNWFLCIDTDIIYLHYFQKLLNMACWSHLFLTNITLLWHMNSFTSNEPSALFLWRKRHISIEGIFSLDQTSLFVTNDMHNYIYTCCPYCCFE